MSIACTDVFGVETSDLGNINKIKIGHDGKGFGSGWFLDKVLPFNLRIEGKGNLLIFVQVYVINPISKQEWVFLCGRWLDTTEDDGKTERVLVASEDGVASSPCILSL